MKSWHFVIYIAIALLGFSIVTVFSTDTTGFGSNISSYQFSKHLLWILIGSVLLAIMTKVDYHYLQKLSIPILVISFILLLLVMLPGIGTVTNGARRWIRFGNILGIQPSEFSKLAIIIFISGYIAKNQDRMYEFKRGYLLQFLIVGATSALVIKEPDFGTSVFIIILSLIMLVVGGTRIIFILLTFIASAPFIYEMLFDNSYKETRMTAFLNPWEDPAGAGYHIIQSWIALGSGGITGLGIGGSKQKLFFLPESSSDFIFSMIGIGILINIARQSAQPKHSDLQIAEEEHKDGTNRIFPIRILHSLTSRISSFSWK